MRLGISTSCFYPMETEKALELLCKGGVKNCEIFFNASCELEPQFVEQLSKIKDYYGTEITSIHPTMSLAESFMLFSNYDRRLKEGLMQYARYGEIAARLGARYVVMHGGKPNGILDDDEYCGRFLEISDEVLKSGAVLLQENVAKYRASELGFLKNMVKNLGERAAFCLDVKQCIRGGYSPFDMLEAVGSNIRHLHISDNNSYDDCLLPPRGDFNFDKFFKNVDALGYKGAAIIEVYRRAFNESSEVFGSLDKLMQK